MSVLMIPDENRQISNYFEIMEYLRKKGIHYEKWILNEDLAEDADEKGVLDAFKHRWQPYMQEKGYQSIDVICVSTETPNLPAIKEKFLKEHTHTEDEVRFFVKGQGLFWFHLAGQKVFALLCQEGDLLSVPAGFPHWFDMGDHPYVKVIRMFTDPSGWVAHYTSSGVDEPYNKLNLCRPIQGANW